MGVWRLFHPGIWGLKFVFVVELKSEMGPCGAERFRAAEFLASLPS